MFILGKQSFHKIFMRVLIANSHISAGHGLEIYSTKIVYFSGSNQQDFPKSRRDKGIVSQSLLAHQIGIWKGQFQIRFL